MTTVTLTVNDHVTELIRRVAARERTDETRAAPQLLEWAATRRGNDDETDAPNAPTDDWSDWDDDDAISIAHRQRQIRQIFERNEW